MHDAFEIPKLDGSLTIAIDKFNSISIRIYQKLSRIYDSF